MKWWEVLGIIVIFGGLIQFIEWIFDAAGIKSSIGTPVSFLLSAIFALLITLIIIVVQLQTEVHRIGEFLKRAGYKVTGGVIETMIHQKKGMIDARILWILVILILLYLLWKAGVFASIFG